MSEELADRVLAFLRSQDSHPAYQVGHRHLPAGWKAFNERQLFSELVANGTVADHETAEGVLDELASRGALERSIDQYLRQFPGERARRVTTRKAYFLRIDEPTG